MSASWTSRVRFEVRIDARRPLGPDRADLRHGDLEVRQDLEQVRLELLVRPVDLVDEQDRRDAVVGLERLEQRPPDQEIGPEDVVRARPIDLAARLEQPDLEHLARVVPLVHRRVDVEALVALEPDQPRAEARREDLRELRLADAGLALEQQRPAELEGQEHRRRERPVGDVAALAEGGLHGIGRGDVGRARPVRRGRIQAGWWCLCHGRHSTRASRASPGAGLAPEFLADAIGSRPRTSRRRAELRPSRWGAFRLVLNSTLSDHSPPGHLQDGSKSNGTIGPRSHPSIGVATLLPKS